MKRRGFLSLLGLAPAAPLIAKELIKQVETPVTSHVPPEVVHYNAPDFNPMMCTVGTAPVYQFYASVSAAPFTGDEYMRALRRNRRK